jgi:hypothetical protein
MDAGTKVEWKGEEKTFEHLKLLMPEMETPTRYSLHVAHTSTRKDRGPQKKKAVARGGSGWSKTN